MKHTMSRLKHYEIESEGDVLVIIAKTSMAGATGPDLMSDKQALDAHVADNESTKVVVDFHRTTHFDSTVVNTLTQLWNRLKTSDGRMAVCCLSPFGREILAAARLDTILDIFPTHPEAIGHVRQ